MKLVSIYGLVNTKTRKVFYVGATGGSLKLRLSQHISCLNNQNYNKERNAYIKNVISSGYSIRIKLLDIVPEVAAQETESFYYKQFKAKGYRLIQSDTKFSYNSVIVAREVKRKIISTVSEEMLYDYISR